MNLYIGEFWVPFPASEYGGMWVVIADNEGQCIDLLTKINYHEDYEDLIVDAVKNAQCFKVEGELQDPRIISSFLT